MWNTRGGSVALGDPGKLCHPVIISSLPVSCQPAHRSGDHHHGDWLSGLRGSCQRKPSSAADCEYLSEWHRTLFLLASTLRSRLFWCYCCATSDLKSFTFTVLNICHLCPWGNSTRTQEVVVFMFRVTAYLWRVNNPGTERKHKLHQHKISERRHFIFCWDADHPLLLSLASATLCPLNENRLF